MIRLLVDAVPTAGTLELPARESRYLAKVRRAAPGESLELADRDGRRVAAVVERLGRGAAMVRIVGPLPDAPWPVPIHVLVAVPRRNLFDTVVRSASELGASRLTPVLAGRSVMLPGDGRLERWRRIADEAMRQCGRRTPLVVDPPVSFAQALDLADPRSLKLIMQPHPETVPLAEVLAPGGRPLPAGGTVTVAVGPEGGFEEDEVEEARGRGFVPVRLGETVFRTETAALAAVAVVAALAPRAD